jgi:hypothetical protein
MAVASGVTVGQGSSCAAFRANAAGLHLERVPRRPRRVARCGGAVVALIATTPVKITRLRMCYAGPVRALCGAAAIPVGWDVFFLDEANPESRPDTEDAGIIR